MKIVDLQIPIPIKRDQAKRKKKFINISIIYRMTIINKLDSSQI